MPPSAHDRVTAFSDADLAFYVSTYRDADRLAWMLGHLRAHYPAARVVVCSDGDPDPRLPGIAAAVNATFVPGERLYGLEHGGKLLQRMFGLLLAGPQHYLFKIDTDTGFHRRFAYLPAGPGVFGTLQFLYPYASVQGGFIGVTRGAADAMHGSRRFLDPAHATARRTTWAENAHLQREANRRGIVLEEWVIGHVATALGVPQFAFPEVLSNWKVPVPNPDKRYAVTHPCKDMGL